MEIIQINYIGRTLAFNSFYTYYSCHIYVSTIHVFMDTEISSRDGIFLLSSGNILLLEKSHLCDQL